MFGEFFIVMLFAFILELVDSSLGMGYGTILSPLLLVMGYSPFQVIPSILLSQAIAGFFAGMFHERYKHVSFIFAGKGIYENIKRGFTKDLRIVLMVAGLGIVVTVFAVYMMLTISPYILKTYIGILVLIIGFLLVFLKGHFSFSWWKMFIIGLLSTFNKGFTGGGFGPVLTGGQMLGGQKEKSSIGCTTLSEGPVCLTGFLAYIAMNGVHVAYTPILLPMLIGASLAGPLGPFIVRKVSHKKLRVFVGLFMVILGIVTLLKAWL